MVYPKYHFGTILVGLGIEIDGIFYDHLANVRAIWYILW
jgi:hypothetical protein